MSISKCYGSKNVLEYALESIGINKSFLVVGWGEQPKIMSAPGSPEINDIVHDSAYEMPKPVRRRTNGKKL